MHSAPAKFTMNFSWTVGPFKGLFIHIRSGSVPLRRVSGQKKRGVENGPGTDMYKWTFTRKLGVLPLSSALSGIPRDATAKTLARLARHVAFVASRGLLDNRRHAVRKEDWKGKQAREGPLCWRAPGVKGPIGTTDGISRGGMCHMCVNTQ